VDSLCRDSCQRYGVSSRKDRGLHLFPLEEAMVCAPIGELYPTGREHAGNGFAAKRGKCAVGKRGATFRECGMRVCVGGDLEQHRDGGFGQRFRRFLSREKQKEGRFVEGRG